MAGKKILLLVGDYEVMVPFLALLAMGHTVHTVCLYTGSYMVNGHLCRILQFSPVQQTIQYRPEQSPILKYCSSGQHFTCNDYYSAQNKPCVSINNH